MQTRGSLVVWLGRGFRKRIESIMYLKKNNLRAKLKNFMILKFCPKFPLKIEK